MINNVLIVAAHADDEVLGCGGTIARHIAEDDNVKVIFMADGVSSRNGIFTKQLDEREMATKKALTTLGVVNYEFLAFPDNKMDSIPLLDIVQKLEKSVLSFKPNIIYTHHYGDLNVDHRITHQAVMTVCRPQPNFCVKKIYTFEVMSSTEWSSSELMPFLPNTYVDISEFLAKKLNALSAYQTEMRDIPHSRSMEHSAVLAKHRGYSVGIKAAEAFMLIRELM